MRYSGAVLRCISSLAAALALHLSVPSSVDAQSVAQSAAATIDIQDDSALVKREREMWSALHNRDTLAFQRAMANVVDVDVSGIRRATQASLATYVTQCQLARYELSDLRILRDSATAVLTYKASVEQTCWGQKAPSPLNVMTIFEKRASGWIPVAHSETPAAHW